VKEAKGWQGFSRAYDLFKDNTLPMKISSHRFANGLKCMLTIRHNPMSYYEQPKNDLGGYDQTTFQQLQPQLFGKACSEGDKDITFVLYESIQSRVKNRLFKPVETEMFKGLHFARGWLLIYKAKGHKAYLVFVWSEQSEIHSMFSKKLRNGLRYKRIRLSNIRNQIVNDNTGLEVILYTGCIFLFHTEEERELVSSKLVRLREKWCNQLQYYKTLDPVKMFEKCKFSKRWENRQMSTLDYLMCLNTHSSRSYENLSQYPVFP
jgi:hypothetical protein